MFDLTIANVNEPEPFLSIQFFNLGDAERFVREELGAPDEWWKELRKTGALSWGTDSEETLATLTGPASN